MTEQPDIEIYLKRVSLADILDWLGTHFTLGNKDKSGDMQKIALLFNNNPLTCCIVEKAVKGGYTSVLFEPNHTPWVTDEDCAREAFERFQAEVRCTTGGWDVDAGDTGGWYRFTAQGQSVVNWLA